MKIGIHNFKTLTNGKKPHAPVSSKLGSFMAGLTDFHISEYSVCYYSTRSAFQLDNIKSVMIWTDRH